MYQLPCMYLCRLPYCCEAAGQWEFPCRGFAILRSRRLHERNTITSSETILNREHRQHSTRDVYAIVWKFAQSLIVSSRGCSHKQVSKQPPCTQSPSAVHSLCASTPEDSRFDPTQDIDLRGIEESSDKTGMYPMEAPPPGQ